MTLDTIERILTIAAWIFVVLCFNSLTHSVSDAASSLRDIKWSLQSRNNYQHQKHTAQKQEEEKQQREDQLARVDLFKQV
jgi:Sec-independent protein translocase protein TatA